MLKLLIDNFEDDIAVVCQRLFDFDFFSFFFSVFGFIFQKIKLKIELK